MNKKFVVNRIILPLLAIALILSVFILLSGCVQRDEWEEGKLKVVATTTMLYDLTKQIGGEKVSVIGLMNAGVDPHLYKASAGDVKRVTQSEVLVYSGLHLEGKMEKVFENAEKTKFVICATASIPQEKLLSSADGTSLYDPHFWFDLSLWKYAAREVASGLSQADGGNAEYYAERLEAYLNDIDELEAYTENRVAEIAESKRVLVTAHDAFQYFGRAYGIEVRGIQGISTNAETTTGDISKLADFIAQRGIKAIFIESSVPANTVNTLREAVLARGASVEVGGSLYSDSIGDQKSGTETFIKSFKHNIDTIVDALK